MIHHFPANNVLTVEPCVTMLPCVTMITCVTKRGGGDYGTSPNDTNTDIGRNIRIEICLTISYYCTANTYVSFIPIRRVCCAWRFISLVSLPDIGTLYAGSNKDSFCSNHDLLQKAIQSFNLA